ncbi:MAG: tetratricopeptide repeat protein, partial [Cyclobacteriaceae bacterium]|nr:tetratricopeptide repeat protein [Cyclobacteriaceae bacterium HetDA_MAG_MS6]
RGLNNTALVYRYSGQNELALEWLQKSVRLDDSLGLEEPLGDSYNNIALVLVDMKNERLAKEYYFKSLKIKEKYENKRGVFSAYQNIGILYKKIGNYDSALYCFKKGLALAQELSYHKGLIQSNTDLAVVHNILGNRDQAFVHSGRALELALEAQDKDAIAAASLNHGDSHRLRGNYDEARRLIEMGLKASLEVGKMEYTVEAYKMLSQLYEQLQSYKKALEYHKLHKQTSDTLSSTYNSEKMAELQTKYETQKKEQQIAEQDVQINQQLAALQQNRIILIAVSITSVLVLFIVLLLRNRQRRKEQLYLQAVQLEAKGAELNASVSAQEKERARYARDLHDGFGQMISILNINLKNLENDPTRDERQVVFDTSAQVLSDMYDELKNICFDLMPETLIKYGLASALKEFTNRINSLDKIFIELDVFGLESRLSEVLEISLYRICQEWINNILKYSDASKVTIQITTDQKELTLMIEDDGMGFDKAILQDSDGNGWKNLQGRVSIIKGQLELETTPGVKGNSLIVDAPVSYINIDQSTTVST